MRMLRDEKNPTRKRKSKKQKKEQIVFFKSMQQRQTPQTPQQKRKKRDSGLRSKERFRAELLCVLKCVLLPLLL